jgi:hypothetical protein
MTRFARFAFGLTVGMILAVSLLTGCTGTTKTGTKYTVTANRKLEAQLHGDLTTIHNKSVEVLRDQYAFTITREAKDAMEGVVEATTARNDKVSVHTYKAADDMTTVKVWFGGGPFGDTSRAEDLLGAIEEGLPQAAAGGETSK